VPSCRLSVCPRALLSGGPAGRCALGRAAGRRGLAFVVLVGGGGGGGGGGGAEGI